MVFDYFDGVRGNEEGFGFCHVRYETFKGIGRVNAGMGPFFFVYVCDFMDMNKTV